MALTVTLDGLIQSVVADTPSGDVLDQLATASGTAVELGDLGDSLLGYFVDRCRRDGHSWAEIGAFARRHEASGAEAVRRSPRRLLHARTVHGSSPARARRRN